jgi:hypothetical protein
VAGALELYDVLGNSVMRDYFAPWSQFKKVNISALPDGIYFCKLKWETAAGSIKIIKQ